MDLIGTFKSEQLQGMSVLARVTSSYNRGGEAGSEVWLGFRLGKVGIFARKFLPRRAILWLLIGTVLVSYWLVLFCALIGFSAGQATDSHLLPSDLWLLQYTYFDLPTYFYLSRTTHLGLTSCDAIE